MTTTGFVPRRAGQLLFAFVLTMVAAPTPVAAQVDPLVGRPILSCPVDQPEARNGAAPDPELLKKIIRCKKGEKAAAAGYKEGAVTVEVTALRIGAPRPWSYRQDTGNGQKDTVVYPVKVTYTERVHYRTRTEVSENWIRILNCYVNAFGEWQIGSEEPVKSPETRSIPRD